MLPTIVVLVNVKVAVPIFFTVTDCAAEVVPTAWLPKERVLGFRLTAP